MHSLLISATLYFVCGLAFGAYFFFMIFSESLHSEKGVMTKVIYFCVAVGFLALSVWSLWEYFHPEWTYWEVPQFLGFSR